MSFTQKRERPEAGFYRRLHSLSSVDFREERQNKGHTKHLKVESADSADSLPEGEFRVRRLVTERTRQVRVKVSKL